MYTVNKETLLIEILENVPETAPYFASIGMQCMTCSMAKTENIEQACAAHGHDVDEFIKKLNKFIADLEAQEQKDQ